jgi:hypothetical protein
MLSTEDDVELSVVKLVLYAMAEVFCNTAFCVTSEDSISVVVVTWSELISVVGDVDIRSTMPGDDGVAMSFVVSIVPDSSEEGTTLLMLLLLLLLLLLLPTMLTKEDDVEVSVDRLVL